MKSYSIISVIFIIINFNLINCNSNKNPIYHISRNNTLKLNDTLSLAIHDTLFNYSENIWLSFDSLITDSRCPLNIYCKWEGNAQVSFIFNSKKFDLNTYRYFTNDTTILNYHIKLINVFPYPTIDSLISNDKYSTGIIVTRK